MRFVPSLNVTGAGKLAAALVMRNVIVTGVAEVWACARRASWRLQAIASLHRAPGGTRKIYFPPRREQSRIRWSHSFSRLRPGGTLPDIGELVRGIRTEFRPIYGLVNSAAVGTDGLLAIMHNSRIEDLVTVNTISHRVPKYVVRWMMADVGGRIDQRYLHHRLHRLQWALGLRRHEGVHAGLHALALAREGVGRSNITVNAVAPEFLETEMTKGLAGEQREQVARRSALRRLAEA